MLVATSVLWGISFPVMKMTNQVMLGLADDEAMALSADAFGHFAQAAAFLVCVRFSLALVLLWITQPAVFAGMSARHWGWGVATGLGFSVGMILQNMALNEIPASRSGFLTSLTVVFTPVLLLLFRHQLPAWSLVLGGLLALLGMAVLTGMVTWGVAGPRLAPDWSSQLGWGDVLTILAAWVFAGQILLIDRASSSIATSQLSPGLFLVTILVGGAAYAIASWSIPSHSGMPDWRDWLGDWRFWGLTGTLSIFCTVVAFQLMNSYQPFVSPSEAAVIYALEPLFATLWAMCLPGWLAPVLGLHYASERPGWGIVMGGLLLIVANLLALWPGGTQPDPPADRRAPS